MGLRDLLMWPYRLRRRPRPCEVAGCSAAAEWLVHLDDTELRLVTQIELNPTGVVLDLGGHHRPTGPVARAMRVCGAHRPRGEYVQDEAAYVVPVRVLVSYALLKYRTTDISTD